MHEAGEERYASDYTRRHGNKVASCVKQQNGVQLSEYSLFSNTATGQINGDTRRVIDIQ